MDERAKGAWVLHHLNKLQHVTTVSEYDNIITAGKMGTLLSSLSATDQTTLTMDQVRALSKAARISVSLELPSLLGLLERKHLINQGKSGIEIIGVTSASVLDHTASSFDSLDPTPAEKAAIGIAETASQMPIDSKRASEMVSDTYKIANKQVADFLTQSEEIGFVDSEEIEKGRKLYFNGNLFRRESAKKNRSGPGFTDAARCTEDKRNGRNSDA